MNPTAALNAYTAAAKLVGEAQKPAATPDVAQLDKGGFADMVKSAVANVQATGDAAEAKAADMATGKADIVDVVTAVAETELAIESMVTVRDRVITAYQEILNMPI